MADFAKLDTNNIVVNIFCIDDSNASTESAGIEYCKSLYGDGTYVQFFKDSSQRQRPAGIGSYYDSTRDIFYYPKPFSSWVWSDSEKEYVAPISKPSKDLIDRAYPYTDTDVMAAETNEQYKTRLQFGWDEDRGTWRAKEFTTTTNDDGDVVPQETGNEYTWNSTTSEWDAI